MVITGGGSFDCGAESGEDEAGQMESDMRAAHEAGAGLGQRVKSDDDGVSHRTAFDYSPYNCQGKSIISRADQKLEAGAQSGGEYGRN
jgi:hypothetical protein